MTEMQIQMLIIVGSNLLIMLTFFGISVSLHNGIREEIRAMQVEMKDFHTQLALQDMEFKNAMKELQK